MNRPSVITEAVERLCDTIEVQRIGCVQNGSLLYGDVLTAVQADVRAGGPCADVLVPWAGAPFSDAVVLRFLGGVHRLALEGRAGELSAHYPSTGGRPGRELARTFTSTVAAHRTELERRMADGVQTNEVGRSVALLGGFPTVAARGLPLRVLEVGASAGLNLRFDHYRFEAGGKAFGPTDSPVRFVGAWSGPPPALDQPCLVSERRGCDVAPIDPTTSDGRLTLRSYVWPDLVDRLDRLDAAIAVARRVPAVVDRADAPGWLEEQLARATPDVSTVVVHSIMFQYLSTAARRAMLEAIDAAGRRATPDAPLAWLRMEPGGEHAEVRLTTWPGNVSQLVATSSYHGPPVRWSGRHDGSQPPSG